MSSVRQVPFRTLHLFALCSFAVAQPIFSVVARYPEFLVAHAVTLLDLVAFAAIVTLGPPLLPAALKGAASLFGRLPGRITHLCMVCGLLTLILYPALHRVGGLPGPAAVACSLFTAVPITWFYSRSTNLRSVVSLLGVGIILFPAIFIANTKFTAAVSSDRRHGPKQEAFRTYPRIVFVLFDEFTLVSLLGPDRRIDPMLYPNFAELSKGSLWLRNATTSGDATGTAVAALLTGKFPDKKRPLPLYGMHKKNLFTLLASAGYSMNVHELCTSLCPDDICGPNRSASAGGTEGKGLGALLLDSSALYLHVVSPPEVAKFLPSIAHGWSGFWADSERSVTGTGIVSPNARRGRWNQFVRYVQSIKHSGSGSLHYLHFMLPHAPYVYLPDGTIYGNTVIDGLNLLEELAFTDERVADVSYQSYLLQTCFADTLLGYLVRELKNHGIWDESLVIVVSDHGAGFVPSSHRRKLSATNAGEIAPILMFIKHPGQRVGETSDTNAESIDLLPTIVETLGAQTDWRFDGVSLNDRARKNRPAKTVWSESQGFSKMVFPSDFPARWDALNRKLSLFERSSNPRYVRLRGPEDGMLGGMVDNFPVASNSDMDLKLDGAKDYEDIRIHSGRLPACLTGRLIWPSSPETAQTLAISVNGIIAATMRSTRRNGQLPFSVVLPSSVFREGKNDVGVYVVNRDEGRGLLLIGPDSPPSRN